MEASASIQSNAKVRYVMVFVLENRGDTAVRLCHCDLLKTAGFTRSQIENKGVIEPGLCNVHDLRLLC